VCPVPTWARDRIEEGLSHVTRQRDDERHGTEEPVRRRRAAGGHRVAPATEPEDGPERRPARSSRAGRRTGPVVAVTGAAGPAGAAVAAGLQLRVGERGGPRRVIAVDTRQGDLEGPEWRVGDVATPMVADCLAGAEVVVHVAAPDDLEAAQAQSRQERRGRAVRAAQAVATAAAAVGARHLVVVTSAMVLGARQDNPIPLDDDAPVAAAPDDGLVGDLLEVEHVIGLVPSVHPGLALTVVRPAALVGPGVDTVTTRHFEAPRLLVLRGGHGRWQFCHVDDLAAAVVTVVEELVTGAVTVGSDGALADAELESLSGMRRLEVPHGIAFGTAERLHKLGVMSMPGTDLAYVVYPWVVSARRLREAGWEPTYDNAACLAVLQETVKERHAAQGRRLDRRDAALGAAGAAVALVGTAAILRQARSRQAKRRRPTLEP
jgi:nucleoside-diphosphate-sugar epimerase